MTLAATPSWPWPWPATRTAATTWPWCTARRSRSPPAVATGPSRTATRRPPSRRRARSAASPRSWLPRRAASWAWPGTTRKRYCTARPWRWPFRRSTATTRPAFWWRPAQVWALIRTGRLGQAEVILAAIEARAARRGESAALTQAAWLRGSLAMARGDLDQADEVLRTAALRLAAGSLPFHHGLLDLQHGRCLCRLRRTEPPPMRCVPRVRSSASWGREPFLRASEAELGRASACGPPWRRPRPAGGSPPRNCGWRGWWRLGCPTARPPPSCT